MADKRGGSVFAVPTEYKERHARRSLMLHCDFDATVKAFG